MYVGKGTERKKKKEKVWQWQALAAIANCKLTLRGQMANTGNTAGRKAIAAQLTNVLVKSIERTQ